MSGYILNVVGAIVIATIASLIIPSKKTGKMIEGIIKLCVLLVMVSPIINLTEGIKLDEIFTTEATINYDSEYLEYVYKNKALQDEKDLKTIIEKEFEAKCDCSVLWVADNLEYKIQKIVVNFSDYGILKNKESIFIIEQLSNVIYKKFNLSSVEIIYE